MKIEKNTLLEVNDDDLPENGQFIIPDGITSIGYRAFKGCKTLKSVYLPAGLTEIGDAAFYSCTGLESVKMSDDSLTSIGASSFQGCTSLKSINFPDSLTEIKEDAFHGCIGLESISLPHSLTLIAIGSFQSCTSLTSVTFSDRLEFKSIDVNAFYDSKNLEKILIDTNNKENFKKILTQLPVGLQDKIKTNIEYFRNAVSTLGQAIRDKDSFFHQNKIPINLLTEELIHSLARQYGLPMFFCDEIYERLKHPQEKSVDDDNSASPKL